MTTPFKLKSGNKTSFKDMGSSPVKHSSEDAGGVVHAHNLYGEHEEGYQVEDDPETGKPAGTTTTEGASYAPGVHAEAEETYTGHFAEYLRRQGFNNEEITSMWENQGYTHPRTTGKHTEAGIKTMEERGVEDLYPYRQERSEDE